MNFTNHEVTEKIIIIMHFEKTCRVCLSESDELTPLRVRLPVKNKTFEETINFVVNIHIVLEHGLPDKICKDCGAMLDVADTFKQRCLESEAMLGQLDKVKDTDECRPKFEEKDRVIGEKCSANTSYLPTVIPCSSLSDSLGIKVENEENIDDFSEHKIKTEVDVENVNDEITTTEQENLDNMQDYEVPLLKVKEVFSIKEEGLEIPINYADEEFLLKPMQHCFCDKCGRNFPSGESLQSHRLEHRKDAPCSKKHNLDNIHPVTAEVTSATEEQEATHSSTAKITEIKGSKKSGHTDVKIKNKHRKKAKLDYSEETESNVNKMSKNSDQKLPASKTSNKITSALEKQSTHVSNKTGIASVDILTCDICKYTTDKIKTFNSHLKAHSATTQYSCDTCSYLTSILSHFKTHVRTHTGEKPFSCDVCEKKFNQKATLIAHIRTHTGDRPYSCNVCDRNFNHNSHLVSHMRIHTGEKRYSCDVCKKKFSSRNGLDSHVRTHTGDKPYSCNVCEKQFRRKCSLVRHLRTHTGDKPYSCDVCEKKFGQKCTLDDHVRTHTGVKRHACNVCQKTFRRKYDLNAHLTTHTDDRPPSCNE